MRMGPVELRMMRGCPPKKQNTVPAKAVPRKLSITPLGMRREKMVGQNSLDSSADWAAFVGLETW